MATFISHSADETQALGEAWGRAAASGWVLALSGELGAGKTQLVTGLARGLGIRERVHSPTFALINIYSGGRLTLFHLDLYRLDSAEQIAAAGLEAYLQPEGVTVIEWAERLLVHSPESRVHSPVCGGQGRDSGIHGRGDRGHGPAAGRVCWVRISVVSESERQIEYDDFGA